MSNTMHEQMPIILKTIEVDVEIVPVVSWLNKVEGIFTTYSC